LNEHSDECDVVIIDIFLREGSGLGLLREAKRMRNDV
jgi:hypothetical protein